MAQRGAGDLNSAGLNLSVSIPRPRRPWLGLLILALAGAGRLSAQELPARCPLDGSSLTLPGGGAWNAAGGEDSDGCIWAVDAGGRWRVPALEEVVGCARCGAAWRVGDLGWRLTDAEAQAVRQALSAASGLSTLPAAARHQRAAACYGALAPSRALSPGLPGELLLRAAWAARSAAWLQEEPDPTYRPRDPAEALNALAQLEGRLAQGGRPSRIEAMLGLLDSARAELESCAPAGESSAGAELARERAMHDLQRMEQELCALRAELPPEAAERSALRVQGDLQLTLARACARQGEPLRRERWLRLAALRLGERGAARVEALRVACAEEARLLGLAGEALRGAAEREGQDPREQARLLYLAGDCARRRGEAQPASALLGRARELDPAGRPAQWAAVLLGQ